MPKLTHAKCKRCGSVVKKSHKNTLTKSMHEIYIFIHSRPRQPSFSETSSAPQNTIKGLFFLALTSSFCYHPLLMCCACCLFTCSQILRASTKIHEAPLNQEFLSLFVFFVFFCNDMVPFSYFQRGAGKILKVTQRHDAIG